MPHLENGEAIWTYSDLGLKHPNPDCLKGVSCIYLPPTVYLTPCEPGGCPVLVSPATWGQRSKAGRASPTLLPRRPSALGACLPCSPVSSLLSALVIPTYLMGRNLSLWCLESSYIVSLLQRPGPKTACLLPSCAARALVRFVGGWYGLGILGPRTQDW